jgi:hypothetical protein
VVEALREAMWRLHPLRHDRLRQHFRVPRRRTADTTWGDDEIYQLLIARAGGWPMQTDREYGS